MVMSVFCQYFAFACGRQGVGRLAVACYHAVWPCTIQFVLVWVQIWVYGDFPMNAGWRALAEVLADWIEPAPAVPAVYLFGFPKECAKKSPA
jgi:hypothetical protein